MRTLRGIVWKTQCSTISAVNGFYDSYAFDGQAGLAMALFAKELSRRLDARGVAVNSFRCDATGNRTSRAQRLIQSIARHFTKSHAQ
jgi:hypothetical protein